MKNFEIDSQINPDENQKQTNDGKDQSVVYLPSGRSFAPVIDYLTRRGRIPPDFPRRSLHRERW